ncbi:MAG: hypothetical protein OXH00_22680 [Candidatus Poribacteria bacterium]|nr:hypothetical protein [Candidatus Poribacteria bacterium]
MKAKILICVFFALLVGFCVYIEVNTRKFVDSLPVAPTSKDKPQSVQPRQGASEIPKSVLVSESVSKKNEQDTPADSEDISVLPAWWDDEESDLRKKSSDPFSDFIAEQGAKERGTLIVEGMAGEELWNAELNQMIEQFGDIPEVHTIMKYTRMFAHDLPFPLENQIEFQEALNTIYPSARNRRTLDFLKWQYSRGNIGEITDGDIAELRAMGISVKQELTETGFRTTISTE